jgi:hypothetical protein
MISRRPADRRRRQASFQPEFLESRDLMTSGTGNTFAIMKASIATAGQKVTVPFTYQPSLITLNSRHQITLGIDVAAQSGSSVVPKIIAVEDLQTHRMIPVTRSNYSLAVQLATPTQGKQATAVLTTLKLMAAQAASPHNYAVVVQGQGGTTGPLLVGFYLPGDANGDGKVDSVDIASIKQGLNNNANSANYNFPADANRDGVVNSTDLRVAQQNLGTVINVTPVVAANLNAASDSGIQDRITNIKTVTFEGTATPGATVTYTDTDNTAPTTSTVASISGAYALQIPLASGANAFKVTASDPFGQVISGTIASVTYSLTAPAAVTTPMTTSTTGATTTTAATTTSGSSSTGSTTPTGTG